MSTVRQDAASLGPGWNKTLHNYALAMGTHNLPITDRTSWKFLAAMHGIDPAGWVDSGVLDSEDLPDDLTNGTFGEQCQHGSWYFLPWHRAYLGAFEAIVAAKVKELTGDDWALPYWNYLDATNPKATHIPDAFIPDAAGRVGKPAGKYRRSSLHSCPCLPVGLRPNRDE
jgi:tyrosinase